MHLLHFLVLPLFSRSGMTLYGIARLYTKSRLLFLTSSAVTFQSLLGHTGLPAGYVLTHKTLQETDISHTKLLWLVAFIVWRQTLNICPDKSNMQKVSQVFNWCDNLLKLLRVEVWRSVQPPARGSTNQAINLRGIHKKEHWWSKGTACSREQTKKSQ